MKTSDQVGHTSIERMPSSLRYARILVIIEITRLGGLGLLSGIQSGLLQATAALFGVGDALVGITAIPLWYALGRGRLRTYGLAVAWVTFGLVDLVYAVIDGALSGQLGALGAVFGPGIVIVPISIVIQLITLVLLLNRSLMRYMART